MMLTCPAMLFFLLNFLGCFLSYIFYLQFLFLNYTITAANLKTSLQQARSKAIGYKFLSINLLAMILVILFCKIVFLILLKNFNQIIFCKNFFLNNFNLKVVLFIYLFFFFFFRALKTNFFVFNFWTLNHEFLLSFSLLVIFSPYIFCVNNLLSLFFFLELSSLLLFYNLTTAQSFFLYNSGKKNGATAARGANKLFFNVLFFQFWASFFSSIFLVYFIINIFFFFGTTEWVYLNFLFCTSLKAAYFSNWYFLVVLFILAFLAIFIKLGVAPLFFFKIEIYKALPLFNILFYSIFFFIFYFLFFIFLFFIFFYEVFFFFNLIFFFLLCCGIIIFCHNLFFLSSFKNFFALSSLITSINFCLLLTSVIY